METGRRSFFASLIGASVLESPALQAQPRERMTRRKAEEAQPQYVVVLASPVLLDLNALAESLDGLLLDNIAFVIIPYHLLGSEQPLQFLRVDGSTVFQQDLKERLSERFGKVLFGMVDANLDRRVASDQPRRETL